VRTARRLAELLLAAAVVVAAVYVNAKLHGIGYHWHDPIMCRPYDFASYWWVGRTQYAGCSQSLTIGLGTRPPAAAAADAARYLPVTAALTGALAVALVVRWRLRTRRSR
jgi:hypothetical protein